MVNYRLLVLTAGDRRRGILGVYFFFFKQKTAYEISECDWSSDECSSDRSEEHTSELQSHSEISYAVFCLRFLNVIGVQTFALPIDRKSTRLNSSHIQKSRMPSSA